MRKKNLYVVGIDKDDGSIYGDVGGIGYDNYFMPVTMKTAQKTLKHLREVNPSSAHIAIYKLVKVNLEKE